MNCTERCNNSNLVSATSVFFLQLSYLKTWSVSSIHLILCHADNRIIV